MRHPKQFSRATQTTFIRFAQKNETNNHQQPQQENNCEEDNDTNDDDEEDDVNVAAPINVTRAGKTRSNNIPISGQLAGIVYGRGNGKEGRGYYGGKKGGKKTSYYAGKKGGKGGHHAGKGKVKDGGGRPTPAPLSANICIWFNLI